MMKLVSTALQLVFVCAGAYGGLMLKAGSAEDGGAEHSDADHDGESTSHENSDAKKAHDAKDDHGKKEKKKKKKDKKKKDGHGSDGHGKSSDADFGFMKFSRQFIVPVITSDNVNALVVIDINLELTPEATEAAYSREPKIRDALLSTLLSLSNEGAFHDNLLEGENVMHIRARLLESAQSILGEEVLDVLILSIARQDF